MTVRRSRPSGLSSWVRASLLILAGALAFAVPQVTAQQGPDLARGTVFRSIGPTAQGNRFVDFAVVESTPRTFFAASASGGVFKTETNGLNFTQVFVDHGSPSVGAVAVSQSNPNVVYVGTGEGNNSRSSYWGDGVYVSTDGGTTWTHAGLEDTQHIGRIVVHPTDPNTAYVAALGHLYSDNDERGLYKTTDGGKAWTKVLGIKSEGKAVGVVDVAMDPKNPMILYASTYDKVRRPWSFAAGGPGSGLYKTIDAGKTWTRLEGGLPTGDLGRIGISIYRQDPNVVYTVVENANSDQPDDPAKRLNGYGESRGTQLFRSDDAGKTWRQVAGPVLPPKGTAPSTEPMATAPVTPTARGAAPPTGRGAGTNGRGAAGRAGAAANGAGAGGVGAGGGRGGRGGGGLNANDTPYYYSQVRVDPNDKDHVFVLSTAASQTFDGGKTWQGIGAGGDNHGLWIDPRDSKHMLLGYDHGLSITFDGGQHWYHPQDIQGAQAYAVGFDMATPYNVYVGLQDNGSHAGPSTMKGGGNIPFEAWSTVGGGDGQYNVVDQDSHYLYNEYQFGTLQRTDLRTGDVKPLDAAWSSPRQCERCNWTSPVIVSPHDPATLYFGKDVVMKSTDRGDTWHAISPDLTVNDPTKRNGTGNITYATITTLDESPIVPGLLWVGTDDGNVQVSKDDGKTWTNVREKIPGDPGYWVSRVEASYADPGTAYVTVTGLRDDDFRSFIWKTMDFGQTWTSIVNDLPKEAINVVREDPRNANLLFVGTDLGLYMSLNGGQHWTKMHGTLVTAGGGGGRGGGGGGRGGGAALPDRGILPSNPVVDLKIQPRDHELIVATHGLGLYIEDISNLEQMTPAVLGSDVQLFEVEPVIRWAPSERGAEAANNFPGMSRPTDVGISYYLKNDAAGDVKIRIYDGSRMVAELDGPSTAGLNTVRWNMQERRERIAGEEVNAGRGGRGGGGRGRGFGAGGGDANSVVTEAPIGEYRVVLSALGRDLEQMAEILPDPGK